MKLLVVEDEIELQEAIAEGLRLSAYAVDTCSDGQEALELISFECYDLVLLDLNLPLIDGLEVLEIIRKTNPDLKVLILSARSAVADKVEGLNLGANDYLSKPFDFAELEARVHNLLRRQFTQQDSLLSLAELHLDTAKRTLFYKSQIINLTRKEFAILEYLLIHKNRVISAEELIDHAWDSSVDSLTTSVRVHISTLRRKLKDVMAKDPIQTFIGEGYLIKEHSNDS